MQGTDVACLSWRPHTAVGYRARYESLHLSMRRHKNAQGSSLLPPAHQQPTTYPPYPAHLVEDVVGALLVIDVNHSAALQQVGAHLSPQQSTIRGAEVDLHVLA